MNISKENIDRALVLQQERDQIEEFLNWAQSCVHTSCELSVTVTGHKQGTTTAASETSKSSVHIHKKEANFTAVLQSILEALEGRVANINNELAEIGYEIEP